MSKKTWLEQEHEDADFDDLDAAWYALPPMTHKRAAVLRATPSRFWPVTREG